MTERMEGNIDFHSWDDFCDFLVSAPFMLYDKPDQNFQPKGRRRTARAQKRLLVLFFFPGKVQKNMHTSAIQIKPILFYTTEVFSHGLEILK